MSDPFDPSEKSANATDRESVTPNRLSRFSGFRWVICGLLLIGVTKNYMDRGILGVLNTTLQHDLGWTEIDYSNLVAAFQGAYAVGMLATGYLLDRLGTRLGYALAMVFWSLASMATAFGSSLVSFAAFRVALGFGEAAVFPASIKSVAEWFPKKERALATGIFNAGTSFGAILTPFAVRWIVGIWGWRGAFISIGALGFIWLAAWLLIYRRPEDHPRVSKAELEYIRSDAAEQVVKTKWSRLLPVRQTWAYVVGKFLTDPVWWFYLFWLPSFLQRKHGLNLRQIAVPIMVVYLISDVGSVAGGWLSSTLIKRGHSINFARKTAMLICSLSVVPVIFAARMENMWAVVLLIGLATAAHQGFSANLYTIASDMFPKRAVASVIGIGGMAGALGGLMIAKIVGHVLQNTGSYQVPFMIAGVAYLFALAMIHLIAPKLAPAELSDSVRA
jgi:ACS family hexuronate transporter-like MFS transporter